MVLLFLEIAALAVVGIFGASTLSRVLSTDDYIENPYVFLTKLSLTLSLEFENFRKSLLVSANLSFAVVEKLFLSDLLVCGMILGLMLSSANLPNLKSFRLGSS